MSEARCYTPDEYAASRKISVRTVYRQIRAGTLRRHVVAVEQVGRQYRIWVNEQDTRRQQATNSFRR